MPPRAPTIQIPRWIQLVGLPLLLILAWAVAGAVRQVLFLLLVAVLVALLLDPPVRALRRIQIPRGFAVAIVYLSFAALIIVALATVVVRQARATDRVGAYFTETHGQHRQTDVDRDITLRETAPDRVTETLPAEPPATAAP